MMDVERPEPRVDFVAESEADGNLRRAYERARPPIGPGAGLIQATSLRPDLAEAQVADFDAVVGRSRLEPRLLGLIAGLVAKINRSDYWLDWSERFLSGHGLTGSEMRHLLGDIDSSLHFRRPERAALRLASELTRGPQKPMGSVVTQLRQAGLEDAQIVEVVAVSSYFNYVCRVTNALLDGEA